MFSGTFIFGTAAVIVCVCVGGRETHTDRHARKGNMFFIIWFCYSCTGDRKNSNLKIHLVKYLFIIFCVRVTLCDNPLDPESWDVSCCDHKALCKTNECTINTPLLLIHEDCNIDNKGNFFLNYESRWLPWCKERDNTSQLWTQALWGTFISIS